MPDTKPNTTEIKTENPLSGKNIIEVRGLHKSFKVGSQDIKVLDGVDVDIKHGDFVIILGPSGCGKSTLLHILLGLEPPTSGAVTFLGTDLYQNTDEDIRANFRKNHIGMVFQQPNWVKSLRVWENVAFPLLLLGMTKEQTMGKALSMLAKLEMSSWANYMPTELSGGQQQRVSLARALINNPEIIVADEPTGNLDYKSGQTIMEILSKLNQELQKTVIMVTHDLEYVKYAQTIIRILDGKVVGVYDDSNREELMGELKFKRLGSIEEAEGSGASVEA